MVKDPYEVLGISRDASPDEVKKAYRKKAREYHPDLHPDDEEAARMMNEINEAYDRIMNPEKYAAADRRRQASSSQSGTGGSYSGTGGSYGGSGYAGGGYAGGGYSGGSSGGGYSGGYSGDAGYRGAGSEGPYGWAGGFGFDWDDLFGYGSASSAAGGPIHPEASASDSSEMRQAITYINAGQHQQAVDLLNTVLSTGRTARWYYLSALANHGAGNTIMALEQIRRAVRLDPDNRDYQRAQRQFQQFGQTYREEGAAQGFTFRTIDPMTICCGLCVAQSMCRMCMQYPMY